MIHDAIAKGKGFHGLMAKEKIRYDADFVLTRCATGLEGEDLEAFRGYLSAEIGAVRAELGEEGLTSFALTGKGDRKGWKGGVTGNGSGHHNIATTVLHFAVTIHRAADRIGVIEPRLDVSMFANAWLARRNKTRESKSA